MNNEITYEALKEVFENAKYEAIKYGQESGGFTGTYLNRLKFKFEAYGSTDNQHYSIFIGKDENGWFLETDETRVFWLATINNMDEMLFLFKIFKIIENE
jgi:hypothetical protein